MSKEKMTGFIMLALLIIITVLYFVFNGQIKTLEEENNRLRDAVIEAENNNQKNSSITVNESTENTSEKSGEVKEKEKENIDSEIEETSYLNKLEKYDVFMNKFAEHIFINRDIEEQREQLEKMTSKNAYQYLNENYYILEAVEESDFKEVPEGTTSEGEYESLELEAEVNEIQTYYTFNGENIEALTMFQLVTDAGEETFSGNFILKGELKESDNGIQMENIKTITSLNEPNADQMFN